MIYDLKSGIKEKISSKKGEMLISLIVAMAIMSTMAVISIPLFRSYQPSIELSAAAKDIASDLRYAQQKTITEQKTHFIEFSTSTDSYALFRFDTATTTLKTVFLPAHVHFNTISGLTNNTVIFNPYGAALEPGTITLENTASTTKNINIKPSGYVELQ